VGKSFQFLANKPLYLNNGANNNRKSYTGSRLPTNSMTLDDLERRNRGFVDFLAIPKLRSDFKRKEGKKFPLIFNFYS